MSEIGEFYMTIITCDMNISKEKGQLLLTIWIQMYRTMTINMRADRICHSS